ncbi:MAG: HAMP domain-containing histidine kinase [Alphaproteobacteria bacterium]|nr:HAMP domain-containing histidine kinase [Alphaproteobacteria bacterium]
MKATFLVKPVRVAVGTASGALLGTGVVVLTWAAAIFAGPAPIGPGSVLAAHLNPAVLVADLAPLLGAVIGAFAALRRAEPERPPTDERPAARTEPVQSPQPALFAALSRELLDPLTAVVGYAELLEDGLHRGEALQSDARRIAQGGRDLRRVVDGLDALARIGAGEEHAFLEWFEVATEIDAVVAEVRGAIEARANTLAVDSHAGRVHLRLDRARFHAILAALLRQAGEATRDGRVTLTVRPSPDTQSFVFRVADDGPPVPETLRADGLVALDRCGAPGWPWSRALDLAVARARAGLLGGGLHLEPATRGAAFALHLPLDASMHVLRFDAPPAGDSLVLYPDTDAPAPERRVAPPVRRPTLVPPTMLGRASIAPEVTTVAPPGPERGRALLVARRPHRDAAVAQLVEAGWAVSPCDDAFQALHLALARRPDVLVVDCGDVPDLWSLRRLRAGALDGVPLVIVARGANGAVFLPVAGLVGSPVTRGELVEALARTGPPGRLRLVESGEEPGFARVAAERAGWEVVPDGPVDVLLAELHGPDGLDAVLRHTQIEQRPPVVLVVPRELPADAPGRLRAWLDHLPRPSSPLDLAGAAAAVAPR